MSADSNFDGQKYQGDELMQMEVEINATSLKAIELYQKQMELVDRVWAYFSQYCSMLILFAVIFYTTGRYGVFWSGWVLAFPLVMYVIFSIANHQGMSLMLDELHLMKGIANSQTRINFPGTPKGKAMLFHLLMLVGVGGMYVLIVWPIWWGSLKILPF